MQLIYLAKPGQNLTKSVKKAMMKVSQSISY